MARRPSRSREISQADIHPWPADVDAPEQVAARVTYTGSPLHKDYDSPAGPAAHRSDKANCKRFEVHEWPHLLEALQRAIRARCVGDFENGCPRRAWILINGILHEARLTNRETGDYHGFPIADSSQYPLPLNRIEQLPRVQIPAI